MPVVRAFDLVMVDVGGHRGDESIPPKTFNIRPHDIPKLYGVCRIWTVWDIHFYSADIPLTAPLYLHNQGLRQVVDVEKGSLPSPCASIARNRPVSTSGTGGVSADPEHVSCIVQAECPIAE